MCQGLSTGNETGNGNASACRWFLFLDQSPKLVGLPPNAPVSGQSARGRAVLNLLLLQLLAVLLLEVRGSDLLNACPSPRSSGLLRLLYDTLWPARHDRIGLPVAAMNSGSWNGAFSSPRLP